MEPSRGEHDASAPGMGAEPAADGADRALTRARVLAGLFGGSAELPKDERQVIAERFEVIRRLGAGAMGEVLLARDRELDREVAVKRLRASSRDDAGRRARILREAKALAKIHHPHVVTLFEVETDGSDVLLAMEYVRGPTLTKWLETSRAADEIVEHLRQAAEGLAAIHDAGLVHRDFKPDNVMVGDDGRVRVADLGLARIGGPGAAAGSGTGGEAEASTQPDDVDAMTRTGALVGTPVYMAPEQLQGAPADARTDQFAFGITLYEALLGVRPFAGDTTESLAAAMKRGERQAPCDGRVEPRWLTPVLARTLHTDPDARYASMSEVAQAMRPSVGSGPRWGLVAAMAGAGVVAVSVAMAGAGPAEAVDPPDPCPREDETMAKTWNANVQRELGGHLEAAVDPVDLGPLRRAVDRRVDDYAARWLDERQRSCVRTHVEQQQSPARMTQTMACLDRRRVVLARILDAVPSMDAAALGRLPRVLSRLVPPRQCASDEVRVPSWAEPAAVLVDQARADLLLGHHDEAAKALADAATKLGDDPGGEARSVAAELAFLRGDLARERDQIDASISAYLEAAELTEAAREDRLAARTWLRLVRAEGTQARDPERAAFYLARARAAVARLGHPPTLEAHLQYTTGQQQLAAGRHAEAVLRLTEARRKYEAAGADALTMAPLDMDLATAHYQQGDYAAAAETFDRLVIVYEREYGGRHPRVASALNNLGSSLNLADRIDEAEAALERALAIRRDRLGPHHGKVGQTLNALASSAYLRGDLELALTRYREALAVEVAAYGPDHPQLVAAKGNIGRTLGRLGRHDEAIDELSSAVQIVESALGESHGSVADPLHGLAAARVKAGHATQAVKDYRRALKIRVDTFGEDAVKTAETGVALAEALAQAGQRDAARATIERWLPVLRSGLSDEHPSVKQAQSTSDKVGGR